MADASRDQNFVPTLLGVSNADGETPVKVYADPTTHRLLVDLAGGAGTVTSVSVVTANGFAGTVATATSTPAITLTTTITGVLKGNGTAISAAAAGTDYVAPGAITTSGLTQATARLLGRTTAGTGAIEEISVGTGLTFAAGSLSATGVAGSIVVGTTTITSGTTTRILYNNAGVLGEYTLTGTGTVVAMQTAPTFATSITTPSVLATSNDSGALGASGTAFSDLFLASGGVINWSSGDITITHATNDLTFAGSSGAGNGYFFDNDVSPTTNNGAALGKSTVSWSDLFLASGGVVNFGNGEITLTSAANSLTLAGGEFNFGANTAYFTETDNGSSSTADTIDWKLSNKQKSTLTGNCTFTFTAPSGPCNLLLKLVQDATGSRTVTWPAAVKWPGGTAPTLTTTANQIDIITFYFDGSVYYGNSSLNFTP